MKYKMYNEYRNRESNRKDIKKNIWKGIVGGALVLALAGGAILYSCSKEKKLEEKIRGNKSKIEHTVKLGDNTGGLQESAIQILKE